MHSDMNIGTWDNMAFIVYKQNYKQVITANLKYVGKAQEQHNSHVKVKKIITKVLSTM